MQRNESSHFSLPFRVTPISRFSSTVLVSLHSNFDFAIVMYFLIEICDCPKSFSESFLSEVLKGLQLCINLRSCAWTRDGTITSQILESLSSCPNLHELELNGRSDRRYDPQLLLKFKNLDKVSIIMPSSGVVNRLKNWVLLNQHSLRSLSLVCKVWIFSLFHTNSRSNDNQGIYIDNRRYSRTSCTLATQPRASSHKRLSQTYKSLRVGPPLLQFGRVS